jgi:hypothetical protein
MSLNGGYQYMIEVVRQDGSRLDRYPVTPDWIPAHEWCHFLGMRRGTFPPVLTPFITAIEPIWHPTLGGPYVEGITVTASSNLDDSTSERACITTALPLGYFHSTYQQLSATLIKQGTLQPTDVITYSICAFPKGQTEQEKAQRPHARFAVEEVVHPLPLEERSLASYHQHSQHFAEEAPTVQDVPDMPVFFHAQIMEEAVALAKNAGDLETGGILIGHLHRDQTSTEIFLEVTAQIPAAHTQAQQTSLSFTPETWAAVQAALTLRTQKELWLGWWHCHPDFCRNCPEERQKTCMLSKPFFSQDDCNLHREVFSRAFNIALLLTNRGPQGWAINAFGWRQGMIASRGYAIYHPPVSLIDPQPLANPGELHHAPYVS